MSECLSVRYKNTKFLYKKYKNSGGGEKHLLYIQPHLEGGDNNNNVQSDAFLNYSQRSIAT